MMNPASDLPREDLQEDIQQDVARSPDNQTSVRCESFGAMPGGVEVELYTLESGALKATLTNFGARLVSLEAPDRAGARANVVLGFDTLDLYLEGVESYLGAIVGRFANRIARGRFSLHGKLCQVPVNNNGNALHGGPHGFDQHIWSARPISNGVEMTLVSPDGDQGFPGTLNLTVRYTLSAGALRIDYAAQSDQETVVNVTNHAYFNLAGESSGTILNHRLMLPAASYTPIDANLIPTGELAPVEGTPFDFRSSTLIGERIEAGHVQLKRAGGYDHNWVLGGAPGELQLAAQLREPASGRILTVHTTEPGIQFYSGNFLTGALPSRSAGRYNRRTGLCLETQHFPDSPNQPHFPSTVLKPSRTMHSTTIFTFSAEAQA